MGLSAVQTTRGESWAVVVRGDAVAAVTLGLPHVDRLIHSHVHSLDLPPSPLVQALETCPRGSMLYVDQRLVASRPITAGIILAFAEQRGFRAHMHEPPDSVLVYAACRAVFAKTVTANDPSDMVRRYRSDGLSFGEIAQRLKALGIKAPSGGTSWHPTTVRRLLQRGTTP